MKIIITALHLEARPIIQCFGLKKDPLSRRLPVYLGDDICLAVCGTGKTKAAAATGWMLGKYDAAGAGQGTVAINFGLAGCPNTKIPLGTLFAINKITDHATNRHFYPEMALNLSLPENSLTTHDHPVTKEQIPNDENSLVDMEGSGFFTAAAAFLPVPRIICLKLVSDHLEKAPMDKSTMISLVESRIKEIAHVLQLSENLCHEKTDPLLPADDALLNELAMSLRLTATQRHQLRDWARGHILRKNVNLDIIRPFLTQKADNKASRNRIFEAIKNELLA